MFDKPIQVVVAKVVIQFPFTGNKSYCSNGDIYFPHCIDSGGILKFIRSEHRVNDNEQEKKNMCENVTIK